MLSLTDLRLVTPAVLERLRQDHLRFARVLRKLEWEADLLSVGEDPNYSLLATIVEYVQTYADAVHHPTEDKVFDRLLHKGLTPAESHMVFLNLAKHQEIIALTQKLQDEIEAMLNGNTLLARKLLEDIQQYLLQQRRHMSFEELHLFPLVESRLNDADWNLIDAELMPGPDPLFDSKLEKFRTLYEYIIEAER